jgi:hypothetical protein
MDWLKEIKKHHLGIKKQFDLCIKEPTKSNVEHLEDLIDAHAISEEAVIYPEISKHGMNDEGLEAEQTEAKELIHYLVKNFDKYKGMKKGKESYLVLKLTELKAAVLEHAIKHEEKDKFKKLYAELTKEETEKLGNEYIEHYEEWQS